VQTHAYAHAEPIGASASHNAHNSSHTRRIAGSIPHMANTTAMHAPPSERFPVGRTLLLGAMFMGMGMTLPIFNHFVPIFLREMALSATLITFILTWDNYLNMFMQPIVGQLSDRTRTRIGRRKPWVLGGAPIALTAFLFVPSATTAYGVMAAIFFTNFGNALFRSPGVALIGDLYPSHQRSLANGIINLMLGVGAALAYFGGGWLYGQYGRYAPFMCSAVRRDGARAGDCRAVCA
jgi:maltose/moltooligosaccharide transporter